MTASTPTRCPRCGDDWHGLPCAEPNGRGVCGCPGQWTEGA